MLPRGPKLPKTDLTRRERQVLALLLGRPLDTNAMLAAELGCTVKNVEFHVSNILRKTRTASRMELILKMLGERPKEDGAHGRR